MAKKVYPDFNFDGSLHVLVHGGGSHRKNNELRRLVNPLVGFKHYGCAQLGSKKLAYQVTPEALPKAKELGFTLIRDYQKDARLNLECGWQFVDGVDDLIAGDWIDLDGPDLSTRNLMPVDVSSAFFEEYPQFSRLDKTYVIGVSTRNGYLTFIDYIKVDRRSGIIECATSASRTKLVAYNAYALNKDMLVW